LVGFSTTITAMIGYDCAVHMCKLIRDRFIRPRGANHN
jgi:hypothetical protein